MRTRSLFHSGLAIVALALTLVARPTRAADDTLNWDAKEGRVTADIQSTELLPVLEGVARLTGWQIYLESNTTHRVSTKFKDLPPGQALRLMLGDLNFALIPETNTRSRLYVFRTSQNNATQLIRPADLNNAAKKSKVIPNELIVRLKPGMKIDDIARMLGAKVVGRIDGLNAYRLQFADEAATDAARTQLANNQDVAGFDSNYSIDAPPNVMKLDGATVPPVQLKLNPPTDSAGRVIVGLIDTAVQPLGNGLDSFLVKSISVAGDAHLDPNVPSHGTSMYENLLRAASVAETAGVSSVQVLSVDVYGPNATTSTFDVASGIVQAVNNGANIINLSLGSTGDSPFLHDLIQQVTAKGIPVFAAAGNDSSSEGFYPAAYPEVISVTAGTQQGQLASYANYGPYVKLIAPGSSAVHFNNSVYIVSGTSTATAFISGLTAGVADLKHVSTSVAAGGVQSSPTFIFAPKK